VIPIKNHYEQLCNAEALRELGVTISKNLTRKSIENWIEEANLDLSICANDIYETVETILTMRSRNSKDLILN